MSLNKNLLITFAVTTASILAIAISTEVVSSTYTNSLNPFNLRTRNNFNKFAKIDDNHHRKGFKEVSNFVKSNGSGTLTATIENKNWIFTYTPSTKSNSVKPQNGTLTNWNAVKKFLDINSKPTYESVSPQTPVITPKPSSVSTPPASTTAPNIQNIPNEKFEEYLHTVADKFENALPKNDELYNELLVKKRQELHNQIPDEIIILQCIIETFKPIDLNNKTLTYIQAVVMFATWIGEYYMPTHKEEVTKYLESRKLKDTSDTTILKEVSKYSKNTFPELNIFGFKIDDLIIGMEKTLNLD